MLDGSRPLATARRAASAALVTGLLVAAMGAPPAGAATSSTLLYSTDGGATWASEVTVAPGGTVQVRQWFDNDGTTSESAASVRTQLPAGFTRQPGSTEVCLNPTTTDPLSPDPSHERCVASLESAVWSGANLQVSPGAGHYGESNASTVGSLAHGRYRYLNLHHCASRNPSATDPNLTHVGFVPSGNSSETVIRPTTNVSNTADPALVCDRHPNWVAAGGANVLQTFDLLGNRYLNLHECTYSRTNPNVTVSHFLGPNAGTNVGNTPNAAPTCTPPGGAWSVEESGVQSLDLRSGRYLHLVNCIVARPNPFRYLTRAVAPRAPTSVSATATPPASSCQLISPITWQIQYPRTLDLVDPTRGAGYVAYTLTAPPAPTPQACEVDPTGGAEEFGQEGSLVSTPSGVRSSMGAITVDWSLLDDPCPTDPIPVVDPLVLGLGAAAGGGALYLRHRRRGAVVS
jgi:hypothetical protein